MAKGNIRQERGLAICEGCQLDASKARITRYVEYAISGRPLMCDACVTKDEAND